MRVGSINGEVVNTGIFASGADMVETLAISAKGQY